MPRKDLLDQRIKARERTAEERKRKPKRGRKLKEQVKPCGNPS